MKIINRPISQFGKRLVDLNQKKVFHAPTFKLFPPQYVKDETGKTIVTTRFEIENCDKPAMQLKATYDTDDERPEALRQMYCTIGSEYAKRVLEWEKVKEKK